MRLNLKMVFIAPAVAMLMGHVGAAEPANELVFPEARTAWLQDGTFPNIDNLRQVAPGLKKDQLYDLLGRPHFETGMFSVKEWDYLFNFRTGDGDKSVSCQYKVIFDDNYIANSFHWKDPSCSAFLKVSASAVRMPSAPTP